MSLRKIKAGTTHRVKIKAGTHRARMLDREYAFELYRLYMLNKKELPLALRQELENPEPSECDPPFDPAVVTRELQFSGMFPVDGNSLAYELQCFAYSGSFARDRAYKVRQKRAVAMQFSEMRANGITYEIAIEECAKNHGVSETTVRNILHDPVFGPHHTATTADNSETAAKRASTVRKRRTAK